MNTRVRLTRSTLAAAFMIALIVASCDEAISDSGGAGGETGGGNGSGGEPASGGSASGGAAGAVQVGPGSIAKQECALRGEVDIEVGRLF